MIDPIFSTAVSAALFATATIPVLLSRRERKRQRPKNIIDTETVKALIRYGKAYAVDTGDSTTIVVILDRDTAEPVDIGISAPISVRIEGEAEVTA
ncbi:MAG: hypothetical protein GXO32_00705 [Crenarchaeota archaeon]|nr:hypothetical protein [Thermoproteota archaeon]